MSLLRGLSCVVEPELLSSLIFFLGYIPIAKMTFNMENCDITISKMERMPGICVISISMFKVTNYASNHEIYRSLTLLSKHGNNNEITRLMFIDYEHQEYYENLEETVCTHYYINYKQEKLFFPYCKPDYSCGTDSNDIESFLKEILYAMEWYIT